MKCKNYAVSITKGVVKSNIEANKQYRLKCHHCFPGALVTKHWHSAVQILYWTLLPWTEMQCFPLQCCADLVKRPTRWSLLFIFGFLYWSSIFPIPDTKKYSTVLCYSGGGTRRKLANERVELDLLSTRYTWPWSEYSVPGIVDHNQNTEGTKTKQ